MFRDPNEAQRHTRRLRQCRNKLMENGYLHILHMTNPDLDREAAYAWAAEQSGDSEFALLYDADWKIGGVMFGFKDPNQAFNFKMRWA